MPQQTVFLGRKYYRYPESNRRCHQKYYTRAGGKGLLHRDIWEHHNGPIPEGHHVHHRDGNTDNNDVSNLECLPGAEHFMLHSEDRKNHGLSQQNLEHMAEMREKAKLWHQSEEGREWHKTVSSQFLDIARAKLREKRRTQKEDPVMVVG